MIQQFRNADLQREDRERQIGIRTCYSTRSVFLKRLVKLTLWSFRLQGLQNGSYIAAFKNVFDWASRIDMKVLPLRKLVVMLAASPGPGGATSKSYLSL
ncbi:hypothetical protein O9929_05665 [Vibrio lentus]|nr:hypothetical protein [Vibrio lentus]